MCVTNKQRLDLTSKTFGCVILPEKGLLFEVLMNLEVLVIYIDTVANLMHDIWKGLALSPLRNLFTRSNERQLLSERS